MERTDKKDDGEEVLTKVAEALNASSFGRDPHPSKSDAGSDGTQPASCVYIQNRQSTYSCGCPMYGACQNNVFCGLFCSATLAIRCRSKAPFVHERLKAPNTSPPAFESDP